jgi:hypothetical protein
MRSDFDYLDFYFSFSYSSSSPSWADEGHRFLEFVL